MAIDQFLASHPHMRRHWCDQEGNLMPYLFVILNKRDVSSLQDGEDTILQPGERVGFRPPGWWWLKFLLFEQPDCPDQCHDDQYYSSAQGCKITGLQVEIQLFAQYTRPTH